MRKTLYIVSLFLGLSFASRFIRDPDLSWHLFGGAWILTHNSLPHFDPINTFNTNWFDYHWLAQIIFITLYEWGGFPLLRITLAVLVAFTLKVVTDIICIASNNKAPQIYALFLLVAFGVLLATVTSVRPQMISVCFIAVTVRQLIQPKKKYELVLLAVLTVLLANMHVYWVMIPFLWGVFRVFPQLFSKATFSYSLVGIALLLICGVISPYTWKNHLLVWEYLTISEILRSRISEMASSLRFGGYVPYLVIAYLVALARLFTIKRIREKPAEALLAVIAPILAIHSIKFVPVFGLFALPFLVRSGTDNLARIAPLMSQKENKTVTFMSFALVIITVCISIAKFPYNEEQKKEKVLHKLFPIEICSEIPSLALKPFEETSHVRILTHFNYGGWCRWSIYKKDSQVDIRVTTDGRTQFVDPMRIKRGSDLYRLKEGWEKTIEDWNPQAAVVKKTQPLFQALQLRNDWKVVRSDEHFAIFVPDS